MKKPLTTGSTVPNLKSECDLHGKVNLLELAEDSTIVLYFYPKDNTSGCTKQAQAFQENYSKFKKKKTVIVGVSPDSIESHKKFREKYDLEFYLLSDPEKVLAEAFGVWKEKSLYGRKYMGIERSTFLIKDGKITKEWRKGKVADHVEEILEGLF